MTGLLDDDFDPDEFDWGAYENEHAPKTCEQCGLEGHRGEKCPTITADLLKRRR
jgi:hypothetical protein